MDLKYLSTTVYSKLEVWIITDTPSNIVICIADGRILVQSHVDLPSTFGGVTNVTLSRLVRHANRVDFACDTSRIYLSINDFPEKIMFWYKEG